MLPTYLRRHGSDPAIVGIVMASYFAASVVTQYPVGRLSDRVGRRPVVLGGLLVFAAGSVGFAVLTGALPAIAFRALQGVGAGSVTVASAATIGTEVDPAERGAAFGALYGSQMLALAVGPLVGSIAGEQRMDLLFLAAAVASVVAALPVLAVVPRVAVPRVAVPLGGPPSEGLEGLELEMLASGAPAGLGHLAEGRRFRPSPAFTGVLVVFAATGLLSGAYEACWTLLMTLRHATSFDVGLSWTLFALPFAVLSVPAGRLASRADRRLLVIGSLGCSAVFCAAYPLLHSVVLLLVFCSFEAVGSVVGTPAAVLVLTRTVPAQSQGAAQGSVETARTAATALAAAGSGALFGIDPVVPFAAVAVVVVVSCAGIARAWRALPGEVSATAAPAGAERPGRSGAAGKVAAMRPDVDGTVVEGTVVRGDGRGRQLGFPTANVETEELVELPDDGVYAGSVDLPDGSVHVAAISIGRRPTYYEKGALLLEAHLLDFDGDLYGQRVRVAVGDIVRGQLRFASAEELVAQIVADVADVRARSTGVAAREDVSEGRADHQA